VGRSQKGKIKRQERRKLRKLQSSQILILKNSWKMNEKDNELCNNPYSAVRLWQNSRVLET
jgi:hypothetical protein